VWDFFEYQMLELFWGLKTTALFDWWSVEHVLSGVSLGAAVYIFHDKKNIECKKLKQHFDMYAVLLLAYMWEVVEHYLETGIAGGGAVEDWLQGVEFFGNRFITDPLLVLLGYFIAKKYPILVMPARILSLTWLAVHIFVFPHSMHLHEILF
jgi:hypothetical protein